MTAFSREDSKLRAIAKKVYRAKIQARQGHPTMKLKHPDWCRDASGDKPNYTVLTKVITEECQKKQERNELFRSKLHANPFRTGVQING